MSYVKILRTKSSDQGTIGQILYEKRKAGIIELPDRNNRAGLSCINAGRYEVKWTYSPHLHKWTYEIQKVVGRGGIRLHSGNFAGDTTRGYKSHTLGCPLPCRYFGVLGGQLAGLASRSIVSDIELVFNKLPFELEIQWT